MRTILITGANRGIGLQFCKKYSEDGWKVIACCRRPEQSNELIALANCYDNLVVESLDISLFEQVDKLANKLSGVPIDILINNAGVYDDNRMNGFGQLDYAKWINSLNINTLGSVKLTEAFLPHIKQSEKRLIVNISSLMGSISDNGSGGSILYRSSKAALNAAMKSLSIDLKDQRVGVLILHPGWVKTDMGGPNALIDTKTSVDGMCLVIENFNLTQTGSFIRYDGELLPW
jgi:NAD(P)-dependent dehydrogenase (short-subunit alcohol dehydrogenase family)